LMNICLVANSRSFSPHAISLLSLPGVDTQSVPVQTPEMQARMKGTSARMSCQLEGNHIVHWYRQLPGEPPKRILYGSCLKIDYTANLIFFKEHYVPMQTQLSLTDIVKALFTVMGYYSKVFGSGTKLIVSGKFSPPANSEILQKKHEDQIVYVCLIEKFYPEVIRVTWIKDGEEVTDNVVKGDTWQSTEEDEYSIASWLTVPAESEDKKYYCKYEHEEENILLETQVSETVLPLIAYRSKSL
uniref:Ig-like domain-containing protein n=1 Tax=Taeniopygia guttata TaxID=59729 RepID=A0A674HFY3_TAEGU